MTERKKNQNEWKFYNSGSTVARVNAYMVRDCNESQTSDDECRPFSVTENPFSTSLT